MSCVPGLPGRHPVDLLKIDRGFATGLTEAAARRTIVRCTVDLGHGLGLRVVAGGIESQEDRTTLAALGCDLGQGYRLFRPCAAEDLPGRIAGVEQRLARGAAPPGRPGLRAGTAGADPLPPPRLGR